MKPRHLLLIFAAAITLVFAAERPAKKGRHPIKWDAIEKTVEAKEGELAADFSFVATNTSDRPVTISAVRTSCGCTVVNMPAIPWVLTPGASGTLPATVDFSGKDGTLVKTLLVESSAGTQTLSMHIKTPAMRADLRQRNQEMARANRQAIFTGSCVQCHVIPAMGKTGEELFKAACVICHATEGRASMVPDLFTARTPRDAAWWRTWIAQGKEGTLMPGFAQPHGILTEAEIESLVEFALARLPTAPKTN